MRSVKAKLIVSNTLLIVAVLLLVGTTIAYFSEQKSITNTMTSGNVSIKLSEAQVKPDEFGNLVLDNDKPRVFGGREETVRDYGTVFPGQTIFKDPTVHCTGTEDAWMAAKITLTDGNGDIHRIIGFPGHDEVDISLLLSGALFSETAYFGDWNGYKNVTYNDHYAMLQLPDAVESEYSFIIFFLKPFEKGDSAVLFDTLSFPAEWGNEEIKEFADFKITVTAFGVQASGLDDCVSAMTAAFPEHINF